MSGELTNQPPLGGDHPVVAVDLGNTRAKLGLFLPEPTWPGRLPVPTATYAGDGEFWYKLPNWLATSLINTDLEGSWQHRLHWAISSVCRPRLASLLDWLSGQNCSASNQSVLQPSDLPLRVPLARPQAVGMDRLAAAVAANHLRPPSQPIVVVDAGTALTIDLVDQQGVFRGGAILPGLQTAATALHQMTDLLPRLDVSHWQDPPQALGTSTESAIRSGLFWGSVGAIRELLRHFADLAGLGPVLITGGVANLLAAGLQHAGHQQPGQQQPGHQQPGQQQPGQQQRVAVVAHLTLSGIALAFRHCWHPVSNDLVSNDLASGDFASGDPE